MWNADLVRVVGDVTVENGVTLTITPGAVVQFEDYYTLAVAGTLIAVGAPEQRIVFTTDEPELFTIDDSHAGCFDGIRFDQTPATNDPSRLEHCIIQYSKAVGGGGGLHADCGGALSVIDFSDLTIANCIIRHCVAGHGGALFLYRNANPTVAGNLITDNHALENASAVYCSYSYPRLVNNTIVGNIIQNANNPYIESCAALNFLARPVLANNIVRDNDPVFLYNHTQLWNNKAYYTRYNNIEAGEVIGGNIDADPMFIDPAGDDFRLGAGSPCIDAADSGALPPEMLHDLDGAARFVDDPNTPDTGIGFPCIDIGAYEHSAMLPCAADINGDGAVDVLDLLAVFSAWGEPGGAEDINGDGIVSVLDLLAVLSAWGDC